MLRRLRDAVFFIYVIIAAGLVAGDYIWLRGAWTSARDSVEQRLAGDASIVASFIQANLVDTSRLLDLARTRIVDGSERRALKAEAVHKILDSTLASVSFSISKDLRGLLFFIDPAGRMVAQSGQFPAPALGFSDRLYYRKLIDDPSAKFAVGNELVARTTGQLVFHISMPVRAGGKLLGLLVQQIRANDVADAVAEFVVDPRAVIVTRLSGGEIAFVFPVGSSPPDVGREACKKSADKGAFVAEAGGGDDRRLVGYASSRGFDLCTIAALPERAAYLLFLREHALHLMGLALAFLCATGLFLALLRLVKRLDDEIELSNHDALTGLRNRRFLDAVYEGYCRDSIRNGSPLSILFIDVDHFKAVNDAYGHAVGDALLRSIAGVLLACVKRPLDVTCRWGGEEFVVLLPDTDVDGALAVARDIQDQLRRKPIVAGSTRVANTTVSIGVVSRRMSVEMIRDDLVSLADKAMLEAKGRGRDRIVIHDQDTNAEA